KPPAESARPARGRPPKSAGGLTSVCRRAGNSGRSDGEGRRSTGSTRHLSCPDRARMRAHKAFWIVVLTLLFVLLGLTADAGERLAKDSLTSGGGAFGLGGPAGG